MSEKKRHYTFGVSLMRSQMLCQAAQGRKDIQVVLACRMLLQHGGTDTLLPVCCDLQHSI